MSADPNGKRWPTDNSAAGTSPTPMPFYVECGSVRARPNFQFIIHPVELPPVQKEKPSKPKDSWLEKQIQRKGWT